MKKKLGMIFGGLILFFIALAVILPLVVNVDRYRPQIVDAANQKINGKLELGKLSLSLWGQIRVEVGGLKLKDTSGKEVLGVQDAYFHIPLVPILTGSPRLTFKMKKPLVSVVKDQNGRLNLMTLMKDGKKESSKEPPGGSKPPDTSPKSTQSSPKEESSGMSSLPGIVTRARLGIELLNSRVTYRDEMSGLNTEVKDLNLILKDLSLSHPTELELWADLDTKLGQTFHLRGPARLDGKAVPSLKEGKLDQLSLTATAKFFNAEIQAQGTVANLASAEGTASSPVIDMTIKSNQIEFKPWVEQIPMLKEYELGGNAGFDAEAKGPADRLTYRAKLNLNGITAKSAQLKAQPRVDGVISVVTDQIDQILLTMKAPGNDLKVQGKMISFTKPKLDLDVTSPGMDLDQLIVFPPPAPKGKTAEPKEQAPKTAATQEQKTSPQKAEAGQDLDAALAPLRQNKTLADFVGNIDVNMKMVKGQNVKISDIICNLNFKNLTAGMEKCGLKVFSGSVKPEAHIQMQPKVPTYQFKLSVTDLNLAQAVESQMALMKNTVVGKANMSMNGNGASFNSEPAKSNLKANGNLKIENATFLTIDVAKMVKEGLNGAIQKIGEKVPAVKGKALPMTLPEGGSKYDLITTDFTISDGKFNAPNFSTKAAPNQGIDLKGSTTVGIKDYSLKAKWDVIDTFNLTHARDLSLEESGVKVEHILAEGNSPVHFPIEVGCTIMAPCYSYEAIPEALTQVALKNLNQAVTGKAKEELRKKAEQFIPKAPPQVQEKLKGLFR